MTYKPKIYYFAPHPIQYNVGLFREIEKIGGLCFQVIFEDDIGLVPVFEKEFNSIISWDIDLLTGYNHSFVKNFGFYKISGFFSRINPAIIKILFKERPDIIILHGYVTVSDWLVFFMSKLLGIKIIFRGEAVLRGIENSKNLKQRIKRFLLPKFLKQCDCILFSCSGNKKYWKFYGVEDTKMLPVPCAVDNKYFQNERRKYEAKDLRKELGINENDFVILFSARFTQRKRPLDLLKSLIKIDNKDITVIFVGNGIERQKLEKFASENKIKVIFSGFVGQTYISKYYSVSDLGIVISEYDPSPKALNEAMNFELPVIVTDVIGTASDLIKENLNGFIVNVGDIKTISEKINFLNKNRDVARRMGEKSFEIIDKWTFERGAFWIKEAVDFVHKSKSS